MPKYLVQATYTAEGLKGLKKDQGTGRKQAVISAVESLGGKVESMYFALGEFDVIIIARLPDAASAAALSLHVSSTGLVRTKTTALLTAEDVDKSLAKDLKYNAPGK